VRIVMFSTKPYDRLSFEAVNVGHDIVYLEPRLAPETATLSAGAPAICIFVNDDASASVLQALHAGGTRVLLLRCAGFNNVDLDEAQRLGMVAARVMKNHVLLTRGGLACFRLFAFHSSSVFAGLSRIFRLLTRGLTGARTTPPSSMG
jgi:hypothetical protein